MGKTILSQKLGRGSPAYKRRSHAFKARIEYPSYDDVQKKGKEAWEVVEFIEDSIHSSPIAKIVSDGKESHVVAAEGLYVGKKIELGKDAEQKIGNILPLRFINEGMPVFNIEMVPGDGGKLVRGSGTFAIIVSKDENFAYLKLPSKAKKTMNLDCRATIGNVAGGGRKEKPLLKAGNAYKKHHSLGKKYPRVRGVAMGVMSHPFGGGAHHPGRSKSTSRNAPPGRKVGAIASRRTGRRK
jgi:large subunit ribosomal protein L2